MQKEILQLKQCSSTYIMTHGFIPLAQNPVLFSGTLGYNLDPFSKYTTAEIWRALDQVSNPISITSPLCPCIAPLEYMYSPFLSSPTFKPIADYYGSVTDPVLYSSML